MSIPAATMMKTRLAGVRKLGRQQALNLAARVVTKTRLAVALDSWNKRRGGIIPVFHEISQQQLASHLAQLAERYAFVSLSEFVVRLGAGKTTAGLAAITFDDGYGPVVEAAAHIAQLNGWPMTFYLPTRYIDTREPYWYQELQPLLERTKRRRVQIDGQSFSLQGADASITAKTLNQRFRSLSSPEKVDELLRETRHALLGDERRPAGLQTATPISWERLRELSAREELSFESHSVNHLAFNRLTEEAMRREMKQSRTRIEEMTGREVRHFCYPFGGLAEIGSLAPRIARSQFASATTMLRGRCHGKADLAMLPRIPLYEGDSADMVALKVRLAR